MLTTKQKFAGAALVVAAVVGSFVARLTTTNGETRYKRPGPTAGAETQAWWDFYWTAPNADQNRCYFPFIGGQSPPAPPPQPDPCAHPKSCVPHATPASGYFSPAIFTCSQTPDGCYVDQAGTTQPRRLTKVGYIYGIGSAHGACRVGADGVCYGLVDQCPIQPSTPTPVSTFTPPPTPTPAPPTPGPSPVCVRVTVTPATVCIPATPRP